MKIRNENRPGYKLTKVGWIPEEWECVRLKSCAIVQTGAAKSSKRIFLDPVQLPYLRVANVQDGYLDLSKMKELTIEKSEIDRYLLKCGDVLFTEGGDFDKLGRGTIWMGQIPHCIHQNHIFAVRVQRGLLLPNHLSAIAASSWGRKYFLLSSKQSTNLASINSTQLKAFPVPLPPLPEQRLIAEVLSAWDRAIALTGELIDAKQRLKKGLMQQLLTGRIRFPEFESRNTPKTRKKTTKGELPEGWMTYNLSECFRERCATNSELCLLSITADRGIIIRDEVERKDTSNADKNKYKVIKAGDIGYNTMRMWQGVSAVSTLEGIVSPAYTVCTPRQGHVASFYGFLFKFPPIIHLFHRYSQGLVSDTLNLKFHHFGQIKVSVPSIDEQKCIASILFVCDREIQLLSRKRDRLQEQKKGLMQKLLTGEVRVKTPQTRRNQ